MYIKEEKYARTKQKMSNYVLIRWTELARKREESVCHEKRATIAEGAFWRKRDAINKILDYCCLTQHNENNIYCYSTTYYTCTVHYEKDLSFHSLSLPPRFSVLLNIIVLLCLIKNVTNKNVALSKVNLKLKAFYSSFPLFSHIIY